jgi:hypothetical protein
MMRDIVGMLLTWVAGALGALVFYALCLIS